MSCGGHCCCGGQANTDVNDEHLIAAFKKAITEHNAANNESIEFVRVVSATKQVVSGYMLRGVVEVSVGGENKSYEIDVWEKAGGKEIEIKKFQAK